MSSLHAIVTKFNLHVHTICSLMRDFSGVEEDQELAYQGFILNLEFILLAKTAIIFFVWSDKYLPIIHPPLLWYKKSAHFRYLLGISFHFVVRSVYCPVSSVKFEMCSEYF